MKHTGKATTKAKVLLALMTYVLTTHIPTPAQADSLPKASELVPAQTIVLVDIDNFSQLKGQFEKTNFYKLYKDPAMTAFVDDVKAKWDEKIKKLDKNNIFRTIIEAEVLPQGRVAIALVLSEEAEDVNEPPVVIISQWGEKIDKIKETISKLVQKNIDMGGHQKSSEDYRGVSIETMIDETSATVSYCFIDDCFIGSTKPDILKFVIAHIKGASSPTLASNTDYTTSIKALGPYHDIDIYVNLKQIIKTVLAQDATGTAQTTIANLGFDNVTSLGASVGIGRSLNSSCCGKAFLKLEGGKKGICKMLEMESATFRVPRFIPASTYSVTFFNLNIKKAYDELYNILYSFNPVQAAMLQTPLLPPSPEGEPGVQLKSDVVDHLGAQIVIAQSINKPFSASSMPSESLFALAVANRRALEKSLSLVHDKMMAANNPDARRELLGHTIYLIDLSAFMPVFTPGDKTPMQAPTEPTVPQMPKMAFTITDTHLIFGAESTVEQAIRTLSSTEAATLDSSKWFNTAKSTIPSIVGLAALEDNAASGELLWWMMKEAGKTEVTGTPMTPNPLIVFSQMGVDLPNFGLLPEFDAMRNYFGLSVSYGISRPDGFFFEFKWLNPTSTD
ncbi:MAG: hypothetical protein JSV82_04145 [Planctomycetota bacterium]|nr:MAG: hypothetical protein JSV82_04145 [Planctomycetota bacterium]